MSIYWRYGNTALKQYCKHVGTSIKVQQIQKRYEEYRKKGQVSDVDYASIVGMGNS